MRFRPLIVLAALAALFLPLTVLAAPGWQIEYQGTAEGEDRSITVRVDDDHVRLGAEGEDEEIVVGPEGLRLIKHDEKMVYTLTFEQIEGMMAGMAAMFDGLEAMKDAQVQTLKDARDQTEDADARAELDKQIAELEEESKTSGTAVKIEQTGETDEILGMKVIHSLIKDDGEVEGEMWTTDKIPTGQILAAAKRIISILPDSIKEEIEMADLLVTLPGFPLRLTGDDMNAEAVSVKELDLDESAWTEAGYETGVFPLMGGMGGMGGMDDDDDDDDDDDEDEGGW